MPIKAVFLDRDNTIIEDPGYLSDPEAVKLLPGVELAVKSLAQAGYRLVVVTNQSGVARGLITEETLESIHAEMMRQLAEHKAHLDAIYYCPYHPEGTVEQYARESDLRKPHPGMLLKAAEDLDLDLPRSWMVGDNARDMEAGARAGCRTVRIRRPGLEGAGERDAEDAQADFTVRNLVDAARVILREDARPSEPGPDRPGAGALPPAPPRAASRRREREEAEQPEETVSLVAVAGVAAQLLAPLALIAALWNMVTDSQSGHATFWALIALTLQAMALTYFVVRRR